MKTNQYAPLRVGLTAMLLTSPALARAQYAYDITPIAGLPLGLNNLGQAVGYLYSTQAQQYHAFEYSNGAVTDLYPTDSTASGASGINDSGLICGTNTTSGPFVYNSMTGITQSLGYTSQYYNNSSANAINQNGDVVGMYGGKDVSTHAFIYSSSTGKFHDINGGVIGTSIATAINNKGQVTGYFGGTNGQVHAFLYDSGTGLQDIGTLPGGIDADTSGINDSGEVVGSSDGTGFGDHAFLYHNGKMTDIGALYGNFTSFGDGLNNEGDIVGEAGGTGFLYHSGQALYLNNLIDPSLGWHITTGTAINDEGQIIGYGNLGGFIMTPHITAVPAPGSLLTFGVGVGVMFLAARRRKRSAAAR